MAAKAEESQQVQKARKKLEKIFEEENRQINQKALEQMKKAMHHWIERHKSERVELPERNIELFDKNKHSAKTQSKFVAKLMKELKGSVPAPKPYKPLTGRIQK